MKALGLASFSYFRFLVKDLPGMDGLHLQAIEVK